MALVTDTHTKTANARTKITSEAWRNVFSVFALVAVPIPPQLRSRRNPLCETKLKHSFGADLYWRGMRSERTRGSACARSCCRACPGVMKQVACDSPDGGARGTADARSLRGLHALRWPVDALGGAGNVLEFAIRNQADQGKLHVRLTCDLAAFVDLDDF
jgi:hypothetical protein